MSPPIRYTGREIADAMRVSRSFKQAAELVGMSLGAMRKRVLKDPSLRPIALACWVRGRRNSGVRRVAKAKP